MLRALFDSEMGDRPVEFDHQIRTRWNNLYPDRNEVFSTPNHEIHSLDISTPIGSHLLTAGNTFTPSCNGSLALYYLHESDSSRRLKAVETKEGSDVSPDALSKCLFLPHDPGAFLTADTHGTFSVWDTRTFSPVLSRSMRQIEPDMHSISSMDMSTAIGGSVDLVAFGMGGCYDICVYDMASDTRAMQIYGHGCAVTDVRWSPTNPFMLASTGMDGAVRLYDVRRAGNVACLVACAGKLKERFEGKREMRGMKRRRVDKGEGLGLGCVWELNSVIQERRRRERVMVYGNPSFRGEYRQVRFSGDGMTLVCAGRERGNEYLKCLDVATGLELKRLEYRKRGKVGVKFEIGGDGYHVFYSSGQGDGLMARGIDDGRLLWSDRRDGNGDVEIECLMVDVMEEAIYVGSNRDVVVWKEKVKDFGN